MNSFIVRHPSYFESDDADSIKACVKSYLKSFNIGSIIESKRNAELFTIIVDDMKRSSRSLVDVDFMNPFNPYTSNKIKIMSRQIPFNMPYSNFIPVNMDQPIASIDNDGLTISPSITDRIIDQSKLQRLALLGPRLPFF